MSRNLAGGVALLAVVWSACNMPRPTPYSGGPGFATPSSNNNPGAAPDADAGVAQPPPDFAPQNPLVGSWQSNDQALDIRADGTIVLNGKPFTYAVGGQTLFVQGSDGTAVSYPFELRDNQLIVTVSNQQVIYTRQNPPNSAPLPSTGWGTPAPTAAAAPPPPSAPGAVVPELVGKWCYVSNVYASDGGRASSTCFALNPDGTYQYHSETSSSGQYGGTASQSDDAGRWTASGNTLTSTSNTGKVSTYTFDKRNHPKNNDPMLVINGASFVTYFQKPPW